VMVTQDASAPDPDPRLAAAERAYEAGNYREARRLCRELIDVPGAAAHEGARRLLARIEPDPVQLGVLLACAALFIGVVIAYMI